jgi:hypothetical protein
MSAIYGVTGANAPTAVAPAEAAVGTGVPAGTDAASLLPEPTCVSGNVIIGLAMLMTKVDQEDKNLATKLEDLEDVQAAKDNDARVSEMMHKADDERDAALVSGLCQIAGGALSIGGACASDTPAKLDWHDVLVGSATAAPGVGQWISAGYKAGADRDDAQAARFQGLVDGDVRAYGRAENESQSAAQAIQQVQQYLQAILQAEAATNGAATGYRG